MTVLKGKAWCFGDLVDTDIIIPHMYLTTANPCELVKHAFESVYNNFSQRVTEGDIIIAGRNFGTGSSREEAVYVLKQMGIRVVIADSIARIYYRNLINLGIYAIQIPGISKQIKNGDLIKVDLENGNLSNTTTSKNFDFAPFPDHILSLIKAGGTINYLRETLGKH